MVDIVNRNSKNRAQHCQPLFLTVAHNDNHSFSTIRVELQKRRVFTVFWPRLADFFSRLRAEKHWGQRHAAQIATRRDLTNLSRNQLLRLEKGQTKHPSPALLKAVAALYAVPYEEVVRRFVDECYGVTFGAVEAASIPHARSSDVDSTRVRELEKRLETNEETITAFRDAAEQLVRIAERGTEARALAGPPASGRGRHRPARRRAATGA